MAERIKSFGEFIKLFESKTDGTSIVIGDSCTPIIANKSRTVSMLGPKGSEQTLWKSGMGVKWLKNAVSGHPVNSNVKDVVINIGTNGAFKPNNDVEGLIDEVRRVFPSARLYAIQGSWGWGGNKNVNPQAVASFYERFKNKGVVVIDPPIGNVVDPHSSRLPVYQEIVKNLDNAIANQTGYAPSNLSTVNPDKPTISNQGGETVINRPGDPYKYKVENDHWLAKRETHSRWYQITGSDFKPAYQTSIDILDSENPGMRSKNAPKRSLVKAEDKVGDQNNSKIDNSTYLPAGKGANPEQEDAGISKEFNFHLIPDGKGTNYRSAQFTEEVMRKMYPKYGIKNIIRLNGDGEDSRHSRKHEKVSIKQEESIAKELGINFYKLSSTGDQDKVNELLKKGNTLVHCAHGADRTGGNVGGYLYDVKPNPSLTTPDEIWKYTTQYNGWNSMSINKPRSFSKGYLQQAQKFGVRDLGHAQELARKYRR